MIDKKFPTVDVCRVFNVIVRIWAGYQNDVPDQSEEFNKINAEFMRELIGRIRHSVYDIPQEYFTLTMSNLIEFQQEAIAAKFIPILKEIVR